MSDALAIDDDKDIIIDKTTDSLSVSDSELERLRKDLESSRKSEEAAHTEVQTVKRQRSETATKLTNETANRLNAESVAIVNAITAATSEADRLESEIVAAQEAGKFQDAAKLTRALATAQGNIDRWTESKRQVEHAIEFQKKQPAEAADPDVNLSAKTRAWIARNPQFKTDDRFRKKAIGYAAEAEENGFDVDTPEYFKYVDDKLVGKVTSQDTDDEVPEKATSSRVNKVAATPPSRNTGNMGSQTSRESSNRLTSAEAEVAVMAWPKLKPAEAQKKYLEAKMMQREAMGNA